MERCINFRDEKLQCHEENFSILIYRFNTSPLNLSIQYKSNRILQRARETVSKIHWKSKGLRKHKTILKKNRSLTDSKTYLKAIVIKTMWYWCRARQRDQ